MEKWCNYQIKNVNEIRAMISSNLLSNIYSYKLLSVYKFMSAKNLVLYLIVIK